MPSCSRLAPLPAPVHYVIGHRVRVREHCSRLSSTQSGLPTGRLSGPRPSESHLGPWPRWRNLSGRQWSLDWRLSLFLLDLRLHNVVVALDTNRGWTCAHIYVRIRTCRIIRDPNNSRSWNFDHNNLRSLKKKIIFGIANYFNQYGMSKLQILSICCVLQAIYVCSCKL